MPDEFGNGKFVSKRRSLDNALLINPIAKINEAVKLIVADGSADEMTIKSLQAYIEEKCLFEQTNKMGIIFKKFQTK